MGSSIISRISVSLCNFKKQNSYMKSLININSWRLGHLDPTINSSDYYYVKLARKLYDTIRFTEMGKAEGAYRCEQYAMAAAYYFEDVVSCLGLWQTFTSKHKELYGKYLPFYELNEDEYYQDEINPEDVCLLFWLIRQKKTENVFLNPENPFLVEMALRVYDVLDAEFEKAPMNSEMLERLKNEYVYNDFFALKALFMHSVYSLYMLQPFIDALLDKTERTVEAVLGNSLNDSSLDYATNSLVACCEKTGPLGLYVKDWLAGMLEYWGMEEESRRVAAIESKNFTVYLLKGYDSQTICLENVDGEEYVVPRNSFNKLPDSTLIDNKSFIGSLVKYDGQWEVNGLSSWSVGTKLFDGYKVEMAKGKSDPIIYEKVMEVNENHPLLYFKDHDELLEWVDTHIGLDKNFSFPEEFKKHRYFALYVDKVKSMSILPYGAWAIKDERNPYYDKEKAESEGINYIISDFSASKELSHYLIEHQMLPDACINSTKGPERGKQLVQENMDFIARCMRVDGY